MSTENNHPPAIAPVVQEVVQIGEYVKDRIGAPHFNIVFQAAVEARFPLLNRQAHYDLRPSSFDPSLLNRLLTFD